MIVMTSNNTGAQQREIAARFPGRVGLLISPGQGAWRSPSGFPYALDNGAFSAYNRKEAWDADAYLRLLDVAAASGFTPRWLLVPDSVANRGETLRRWDEWAPRLRSYGWPLAFAVQDGMQYADVPHEASVIFVGGSTRWKWRAAWDWCREFPRVHIGRVNGYRPLWNSHEAGAESCDGTGWFRGDKDQLAGLVTYLKESSGDGPRQARIIA